MIYAEDKAVQAKDPARIGYAIDALSPFFSERYPDEIGAADCRAYAKMRGVGDGTVRREIGALTAALNHAAAEGHITAAPKLWRPARPPSKERWLEKEEAVRLLNACRHPKRRHLARFILIGLYTGSRADNILGLQWRRNCQGGWIDLEAGLLYRTAEGEAGSKKRRPTAKLPRQLTGHARRWRRDGQQWVVHYEGRRVLRVKRAFAAAVKSAGIEHATPHVLRHTAITWAMQAGAPLPEVSGYFGITLEELQRTYWHHHPDFQSGVVGVMERRQ